MGTFEELINFVNNKINEHKLKARHRRCRATIKNKKVVKPFTSSKLFKIGTGLLATTIFVGAPILIHNRNKAINLPIENDTTDSAYYETTNMSNYETLETITHDTTQSHNYCLEELSLETNNSGSLTSESVNNLSNSIVDELNSLYELAGGELPPIIESETLSSLFFCENGCKPVETEGPFVGIAQMGEPAIKDAISKINKLYNKAIQNGVSDGELKDNYFAKFIANKDSTELFEQAKTDPKLCGALCASNLSWISDSFYTAFGENKNVIILAYNAGVGNMTNEYISKGIVSLSPDKQNITIDLSKTHSLSEKHLEKFNEAITYLIRVNGGSKILKENPKADILDILEDFRITVGKNNNYSEKPNNEQYKYAPDGTIITGYDLEMRR